MGGREAKGWGGKENGEGRRRGAWGDRRTGGASVREATVEMERSE